MKPRANAVSTVSFLASLVLLLPGPEIGRAQGAANAAASEALARSRERRVELLRDEIKALDARIEDRVDGIVTALRSITDSKDSRTKVMQLKETTIDALLKNIEYYRQKRDALTEELRRPTLRLTREQKRKGIEVFDARMERRIAQILELQRSFPEHKDYARYDVVPGGSDRWGDDATFVRNKDFEQNRRLSARTAGQRRELVQALEKVIERIDRENRSLKTQIEAARGGGASGAQVEALADELARNDALLLERRKQLASVLNPAPSGDLREASGKEARDLDKAIESAIAELRQEFATLFARYNDCIAAMSAANEAGATR